MQSSPHASRKPPLEGIRVIDFSHFVAGPMASQLLADWGADVIKIENPERGDEFRHYPPYDERLGGEGCPFLWANRNKKSIAVDLKSPSGLDLVRDLVRSADVVLENFSTGVMEKLGLGYEACVRLNPRIVYCSVSAYGREGKFADRLGFDPIAQAESGFMSLNGYGDREGVRTGSVVMDIGTALFASNAILMALFERERSGTGQQVSTALYDSALTMVGFGSYQAAFNGFDTGRQGNGSPNTSPTGVFYALDGPLYITCTATPAFLRLCEVLSREDLAQDPALLTKAGRLDQRDRLAEAINQALAGDTRENWQARLRQARVPSGIVRTVAEALASPETKARELFCNIPHPTAGEVPNLRSPIRMGRSAMRPPVAAPTLGQHTAHVLRDTLALTDERIAELAAAGAFGEKGKAPA